MNNIDFSLVALLYILGATLISVPIAWIIGKVNNTPNQEKLSDLEYLKLRKHKAFAYDFDIFVGKLSDVPEKMFKKLFAFILKIITSIKENTVDIISTFKILK
jgi:hypothetical protein